MNRFSRAARRNYQQEPVVIIEAVKTVATLAIATLIILNIWSLSDEQQAVVVALAIAVVNLAGMVWQRSRVSPVRKGGNKGDATSLD